MIKTNIIKSGYGEITQGYSSAHRALDIVGQGYTIDDVCAVDNGVVIHVGYGNTPGVDTRGRNIRIDHQNGFTTEYCHYDEVYVKVGDRVTAKQPTGRMGSTGPGVTGAHVDFKVMNTGTENYLDPNPYLNGFGTPNNEGYTGVITYETCGNTWMGPVNKVDNTNEGYAGNYGTPITAVRCKPVNGVLTYQVHTKNGIWLPEVNKYSDADDGFAGNIGQPIDGIRIKASIGTVTYRVHILGGDWLPWVTKYNDENDGFAGNFGQEIDGIQMY